MKKDFFVTKMFAGMLLPSIISSVGFAMSDMVDALVVGRSLGAVGLAAISICLPIYMLLNIIMDGFSLGGGVRFSTLVGEGKESEAGECAARIIRTTLGIGIAFAVLSNLFMPQLMSLLGAKDRTDDLYITAISYARILTAGSPLIMLNIVLNNFLRNDNREVVAARGFLIGNITDIVLNVLFVLVFDMGAGGAAFSTVTGSTVALAIYMPAVFSKQGLIKPRFNVPFNPKEVLRCFWTGFSVSAQNVFTFVFLIIVNRIMLKLGGEEAVAVFEVVYNASFFITYLCEGTSEAAQPLVSMFIGEKSEDDCKTVLSLSLKSSLILSAFAAIVVFVFAKYVAMMFGITGELTTMAAWAVRAYCIGFAFIALNIVFIRYYQAREQSSFAFCGITLRNFVVVIPCVFVMSLFGVEYVWLFFPISELLTFAVFYLVIAVAKRRTQVGDQMGILRVNVSDDPETVAAMLDECDIFLENREATPSQMYCVRLILEEIVTSIIRNAIKDTENGRIRVTLLAMPEGEFMLHILDNAVVFDIFSFRPKKDRSQEDFDIDEVSMKLIKKNAKLYMYRRSHGFNSLTVRI